MRVRNVRSRRFGDDSGDDSLTLSSDFDSGSSGSSDLTGSDIGIGPLSSPEADVGSTPTDLTLGTDGTIAEGSSTPSSSGGASSPSFLSSIFGTGTSTPAAQTVAQQAPAVAAALPFLAGVSTNTLIVGGIGLVAVLLLMRSR